MSQPPQDRLAPLEALMRDLHASASPSQVIVHLLRAITEEFGPVGYAELVIDPTPKFVIPEPQPIAPDAKLDAAEATPGGTKAKPPATEAKPLATEAKPGPTDTKAATAALNPGEAIAARSGEYRISRLRSDDGTEHVTLHSGELPNPFDTAGLPSRRGGFFGRIANGPTHIRLDRDLAILADDEFGPQLAVYRSVLAVPVYTAGHPEWMLFLHREPDVFREMHLEEFLLHCNMICGILNAMRVSITLAETQLRLSVEMERIAEIQRALLPSSLPVVPGLDIAFHVASYDRAGGDLVDFVWANADTWVFLVADASGHGPSAAVVAAMLTAILRAFPATKSAEELRAPLGERDSQVHAALSFANVHLCEKQIDHSFVTAFLGAYHVPTRTLHFSRAGHPLPMLHRRGQPPRELREAGGLPLGVFPDAQYTDASIQLEPGDLLLFYSDGISETQSPTGELFGTDRLATTIATATSAQHAIDLTTAAVTAFAQGLPPGDDRTILAICVK